MRRVPFRIAALIVSLWTLRAAAVGFEPSERYESRTIQGWTVRVHRGFLEDSPELSRDALTLLDHKLYEISRVVPAAALKPLRDVPIWLEENERHHPCMAYHPDQGWLSTHDMNPEKARCVEIANARHFLDWSKDQPWMVLHELAHAYHHQFLDEGFENPLIQDAHRRACEQGRYASVLHIRGHEERAYALTNPMEYFAEASEAFFGTNDFYPFVRSELGKHDPELEALLGRLWNVGSVPQSK